MLPVPSSTACAQMWANLALELRSVCEADAGQTHEELTVSKALPRA